MGEPELSVWAVEGTSGNGCPNDCDTGSCEPGGPAGVGFGDAGFDVGAIFVGETPDVVEAAGFEAALHVAVAVGRDVVEVGADVDFDEDTNVLPGCETNLNCRLAMHSGVAARDAMMLRLNITRCEKMWLGEKRATGGNFGNDE